MEILRGYPVKWDKSTQLYNARYFLVHSIGSLNYCAQMAPQSDTYTQHVNQVLCIKIDVLSFEPLIRVTEA
jgi:hypothetical protein